MSDANFYFWHGIESILVTYMQTYFLLIAALIVTAVILYESSRK